MRKIIVCAVALALGSGCESIRIQYRTHVLPNGDLVELIRQPDGVDAVAVDCRMMDGTGSEVESECQRAAYAICGSLFDIAGNGVMGPHIVHVRCWNQNLPWVTESPERICSNGGATSGPVSIEHRGDGTTVAFAKRANVRPLLLAFGAHDPTLRFMIGDDWARAFCWGGVWRTNDPSEFFRYMQKQGASVERRDDGMIWIGHYRLSRRR